MPERVLVVGAERFAFAGEDGQAVNGIRVHYLPEAETQDPEKRGHVPMNTWLRNGEWSLFQSLPALADLDFGVQAGKGGKPQVVIRGIQMGERVRIVAAGGNGRGPEKASGA